MTRFVRLTLGKFSGGKSSGPIRGVAAGLLAVSTGLFACGQQQAADEPNSYAKALGSSLDQQVEATIEKKPYVAPTIGLPPATAEELAAWDRKDPGGEKHLYKWDKRNAARMKEYWIDIQCFRERMLEEGKKATGADPQGTEAEQWDQFKRAFIPLIDRWQQRLFSLEPRILEKSKFISNFLEAHELVMLRYPRAFNDNDEKALMKAEAFWTIVSAKVNRYAEQLGSDWSTPDLTSASAKAKWDKRCAQAFKEPKKKMERVARRTRKNP
jgi:hypothetical protein